MNQNIIKIWQDSTNLDWPAPRERVSKTVVEKFTNALIEDFAQVFSEHNQQIYDRYSRGEKCHMD